MIKPENWKAGTTFNGQAVYKYNGKFYAIDPNTRLPDFTKEVKNDILDYTQFSSNNDTFSA